MAKTKLERVQDVVNYYRKIWGSDRSILLEEIECALTDIKEERAELLWNALSRFDPNWSFEEAQAAKYNDIDLLMKHIKD